MYDRMISFINFHNLLYTYQFGFRKNYSTNMAASILCDKILNSIDNGQIVVGVFLDFQKAFDTVNHSILLKKLYKYGFRGTAYKWLDSYLCSRYQFVSYHNVDSMHLKVTHGVPQGSILGPLLFLLYINDIVHVSDVLIPIIYADDTNVFINGSSMQQIAQLMNYELQKIHTWLNTNKLSLNISKTQYIIFKTKIKKIDSYDDIKIDGNVIDRVESAKFVGLILDSELKWHSHVQHVKKKIAKGIGVICKARKVFNRQTLLLLYNSFVLPYLSYCNVIWGNSAQSFHHFINFRKRSLES
jgi:hypothetical protein